MKNFVSKSIALITLLAVFGCSSNSSNDSEDIVKCIPIACKNGGVSNPSCGCDCPVGYSGVDCSLEKVPSRIRISKIRVKYFPNKNGNTDWDTLDAPDIFVKLGNGVDSNVNWIYTSKTIDNVLSDGGKTIYEFTPTTPLYVIPTISTYTIALYDYDSVSLNDLMGGFTFILYNYGSGLPPSVLLQNNSKPLAIELFYTYEF